MFNKKYQPKIIAHRGASMRAPENTMGAFQGALEDGMKWIEFDVHLCKTGEAVIIHDSTLDRTTNGFGNVSDTSLETIKQLDAGSWFGSGYVNEQILTLTEALQYLSLNHMFPIIEIKDGPDKEILAAKVSEIIKDHWPDNLPIIVSSFSYQILKKFNQYQKQIPIGLAIDQWENDCIEKALSLNAYSIHMNHDCLEKWHCDKIHEAGLMVFVYVVNNVKEATHLFNHVKADGIFTDNTHEIKKYYRIDNGE